MSPPNAEVWRSPFGRPYQSDQLVAVMLELLVADPGDAAKLVERRRAHGGDAVDGGIVQHDIGRHAPLPRHLGTPGAQRGVKRGVRCLALAGRDGRKLAAPRLGPDGAVARAFRLL